MNITLKLLAIVAVMATCWSCDEKDNPSPEQNELVGKWKLESISGGFAGSGYKADWNYLELKADLSYRRMKNDSLRYEGKYALQKKEDKTFIDFKPGNQIFEDHDKEVILDKDRIILRDPCCDLFEYAFSKVKN